MSLNEVANQLVALCREGKNLEAVDKLYSPDIVSVEAVDMGGDMPQTMKGIEVLPEHRSSVCEIDPQVGGSYRINMEKGDEEYVTVGEFVELDPPNKLVFTWSWEKPSNGVQGTVVTVELFEAQADGNPATELVLTHEKLLDTQNRDAHTNGWTGCLAALAKCMSS